MPLTVGQLRRLLSSLDDRMPVVVPAPDHSYRLVRDASKVDAVRSGYDGLLSQDEGGALPPGQSRVSVFLIGG